MRMTFGGQSGNVPAGAPPIPVCPVPLQGDVFAFAWEVLGSLEVWGREGRWSLLGEHTERETVTVSLNPAGKTGRGLEQQLGCLKRGWWVMLTVPMDHWNHGGSCGRIQSSAQHLPGAAPG